MSAVTAPAAISSNLMTPGISSPTMATPRPVVALLASPSTLPILTPSLKHRTNGLQLEGRLNENKEIGQPGRRLSPTERTEQNATTSRDGDQVVKQNMPEEDNLTEDAAYPDGRMTPIACDSGAHSQNGSSGPSNGDHHSPNSTTISTGSQSSQTPLQPPADNLTLPPASVGLCTLATENQLRESLLGKDRMFLLVLSKEIDAFIVSVVSGQHPISALETTSTSLLAALGPSFVVRVTATSKYQRMLVYKAAEWYGLRAVPGADASMIIGVLESLNEKSEILRLSELVPKPPSPKQNFRIMQRASGTNGSRAGDPSSDGQGTSKHQTLEEKQAKYELARQRIYGEAAKDGSSSTSELDVAEGEEYRGRTARGFDEERDPGPLIPFANPVSGHFQPVYPSLHHPPKADLSAQAEPPSQDHFVTPNFAFPPDGLQYSAYTQAPLIHAQAYSTSAPIPPGYNMNMQQAHQQYPVQQSFADLNMHRNTAYMGPPPNGYGGQPWQHGQLPEGFLPMPPPIPHSNPMSGQMGMQPTPMNGHGWVYPNQMIAPGQPMPMIPQGMQPYPAPYPYPPQQAMYQHLAQPTPMRPNPYPHSSSASSISSRSYHDGSRPHSRGSTTSTRSAASSVRLGAMYPASQMPNYRQKGLKSQGFNGLTNIGLNDRRSTRGHSPSSNTTTSSRSSRRAASIILNPPAQHQLPLRPDWAANNVPYHPSPMPLQPAQANISAPSTTDFPPLLRNGTNAEPMQVERAKIRPSGTVWNGTAVKAIQQATPVNGVSSPPRQVAIAPPLSRTPNPPPMIESTITTDVDPDFPRRVPSLRSAASLYDPTAPRSISRASSRSQARPDTPLTCVDMSSDDIIEAKLAAVSLSAGVSIGPPPSKAALGAPSYAKIVRRD